MRGLAFTFRLTDERSTMVTSAPGNAVAMDWPRAPFPAPISTCSTLGVPLLVTVSSLTVQPPALLLSLLLSSSTGPASPLAFVAMCVGWCSRKTHGDDEWGERRSRQGWGKVEGAGKGCSW